MIVTKEEIRQIRSGELEEVVVPVRNPPEIGSVHLLQSGVGKRGTCAILVLDRWPHVDGGFVVRLKLTTRLVATRYLRPGRGYTTDPSRALKDPLPDRPFSTDEDVPTDAQLAEWAPPAGWKDPGQEAREEYHRELQTDSLERRLAEVSSVEDLDRLVEIARERGVEVRSDIRVMQRRLAALQRQMDSIKDKIREGRQAAA